MKRKTALITGSTKGIGLGIALRLAHEGYNIILNYASDDETAQQALIRCQQITSQVILVKADVSKQGDVKRLIHESVTRFHTLDALINNAAKIVDKPILEMNEDDWDRVVDTNMKGTFLCSKYAATTMLTQEGEGIILNIGAPTGIRGRKNGINTCASKGGIHAMTKCLALELAPKIRVFTIIPGLTYTEETAHRYQLDDPSILQTRKDGIPLGRLGTPEDVANAVVLFLSSNATFLTGISLGVDGGQYMW